MPYGNCEKFRSSWRKLIIEMSKLSSSFAAIFKPTENHSAEPGGVSRDFAGKCISNGRSSFKVRYSLLVM
jgi:hypothetical protein